MALNLMQVEKTVAEALAEDIGTGDITTAVTISPCSVSRARLVARESGVVSGLQVAGIAFQLAARVYGIDSFGGDDPLNDFLGRQSDAVLAAEAHDLASGIRFTSFITDGTRAEAGEAFAEVAGSTAAILTGERVALNFLQRMSGIATASARYSALVEHTKARIVDTRKTVPGLRALDKYAVTCGGGGNHRFGLYDAVLIKDNHIQACGGIGEAVRRALAAVPHTVRVEVEADTLEQVSEALEAGAEIILLDNMTPELLVRAVDLCRGRALTEASGGVNEQTVRCIAESGVDLISIGALTHSVRALDISLDFES